MASELPRLADGGIYEKLGVRPIINGRSNSTVLGGSTPSPTVRAAMEEAGRYWVEMAELMRRTGDHISSLLGTEATHPTAGCAAAIILSSAVAMTGDDRQRMAQLPDTTGMKNEILIQSPHRYWVQTCFQFAGARLRAVGTAGGCTAEQLEDAVDDNTAGIAFALSHPPGYLFPHHDDMVSLADAAAIGRRNDVPVVVDANAQIYPLQAFRRNAQAADLVCFGGKYFGSSHATGFVTGRADLVDAVRQLDFVGSIPYDTTNDGARKVGALTGIPTGSGYAFGRGMKLDRQQVVALAVATDEWFRIDHDARRADYRRRMAVVQEAVADITGVTTKAVPVDSYLLERLEISLAPSLGASAEQIVADLDAGAPRIVLGLSQDDEQTLFMSPHILAPGEERVVASQLRSVLLVRACSARA